MPCYAAPVARFGRPKSLGSVGYNIQKIFEQPSLYVAYIILW